MIISGELKPGGFVETDDRLRISTASYIEFHNEDPTRFPLPEGMNEDSAQQLHDQEVNYINSMASGLRERALAVEALHQEKPV